MITLNNILVCHFLFKLYAILLFISVIGVIAALICYLRGTDFMIEKDSWDVSRLGKTIFIICGAVLIITLFAAAVTPNPETLVEIFKAQYLTSGDPNILVSIEKLAKVLN